MYVVNVSTEKSSAVGERLGLAVQVDLSARGDLTTLVITEAMEMPRGDKVRHIDLSPGGKWLVTISRSKVKVWRRAGLVMLATVRVPKGSMGTWSWNQRNSSLNVVIQSISTQRYVHSITI